LKRLFIFLLLQGISIVVFCQDVDSLVENTASTNSEEVVEEGKDSYAMPDTSRIILRNFDTRTVEDLKDDPALQYRETPTIAESLWDRFRLWLDQLIQAIFENAVTTDWGRVLMYILGIVILVVLIMMLLKVNAFKVFYSGQGANTFNYSALDENIHEMDFEKLIQEATRKNDYRLGVRLVFLFALKMLSDKNLIHWSQGKTNHDYISELKLNDVKAGFNELNFYFEYAWYGNFRINQETFSRVQLIFDEWKDKLK
jgi:hypothetical protein